MIFFLISTRSSILKVGNSRLYFSQFLTRAYFIVPVMMSCKVETDEVWIENTTNSFIQEIIINFYIEAGPEIWRKKSILDCS